MQPVEFIFFASQLALKAGQSPAAYRTAISRAYYGAFHRALQFLEQELGISCRRGGNEHVYVQRLLRASGVEQAEDAGRRLENLHSSRKQADYELGNHNVEQHLQAQASVERAAELISLLADCAKPPLADSIRAGVDAYRRKVNT